jgi:hypothetical protein
MAIIRLPAQSRWKALAAQLLIGTLTIQIGLIDTALTAPSALATTDINVSDLMIPASSENPLQTINRANDNAVIVTTQVPIETSKLTVELIDQFGKNVHDTNRIKATGVATTKINSTMLADGPITLRASIEMTNGTQSPWITGPQVLKDTQSPEKPTITAPLEDYSTTDSSVTIQGEAPVNTTIQALKNHDLISQVESTRTFSVAVPLAEGSNRFKLVATDSAGNQSSSVNVATITSTTINTEPAQLLPVPTHLHATALSASRVHLSWEIDNAQLPQVDHFVIYSDNGTGTVDFSTPFGVTQGNATEFTTATLAEGTYLFTVRSCAITTGTMTTNIDTISQSVMGEKTKASLHGEQQLIDLRPDQPITVKTGFNTTHYGRLNVEPLGRLNPTKQLLPASTPVGSFYSMTTNNQTVFPLEVRIYYTADDLVAGHVANERQLKGLYYFDQASSTWKPFEQTEVQTSDLTVNGVNYAGYVMATTSHLTTMVIAADTIAPTKPANLTGEAGDMRTKLTWNTVSDATGYWVRYRKATNIDTLSYSTVFVSGEQQNSFTVSGLANGTLYEFGVATEDGAGNQSDFAVVEQTPTAAAPTTDFITPATAHLTSTSASSSSHIVTTAIATTQQSSPTASSNTNQSQEQTTPTQEKQDEAQDGSVKGGTDKKDQTQSARSLVTLLIVLVAAAAGFGGYYGYQWWTARPEEFDEPAEEHTETAPPKKPEKEKVDKSDRAGGRW